MATAMAGDDPEDCPTFTRRPPPPPAPVVEAGPISPRVGSPPPSIVVAADDDEPITDVDDGPPTFSIHPPGPGVEKPDADAVTLVNAAPPHQRVNARVVTSDATHLFVVVEGEPAARRISRVACFEHPIGGGWSTWRLSGADRERWHVPNPPPVAPVNPEDVSA